MKIPKEPRSGSASRTSTGNNTFENPCRCCYYELGMSWFQLDPESIAARMRAAGKVEEMPTLGTFVRRGIIGFTLVSLAGFAPWALAGRWFYRAIGEAGLYVVCAVVFVGLSGLLMHRLILGTGSLGRFYKLFSLAFAGYAIAWILGWIMLRGHPGSVLGLLGGTMLMGWILTRAFDATQFLFQVVAALFIFNAAGYFLGGIVEAKIAAWKETVLIGVTMAKPVRMMIAKLSWGFCYGVGFGAGLGLAFYYCQTAVRRLMAGTTSQS